MTFNITEQAAITAQQNAARAWDDLMTAKVQRMPSKEIEALQANYDMAARIEQAAYARYQAAQ